MISGTVVHHPRPRITRFGRAYMPQRYREWKKAAAEELRGQWGDAEPMAGPVAVELVFWFARPKSRCRVKLRDIVVPRTGRGDLDNAVKSVLDAIQDAGIFANDSQVSSINASQWEAELEPWIYIAVEPAEEFPRAQCQKVLSTEPQNHDS